MTRTLEHESTGSVQPPDRFAPRILIVDDHPAVRAGLRNLISSRPGWFICGEATNGEQAVSLALELKPSVVVMDISMPGMDGLEATRIIRDRLTSVEVLIVSQHDSDQVVSEAQRAGARGFVVKSHLSADLLPALEAALRHSSRISTPVSKAWQNAISTAKQRPKGNLPDPGPHDDLDLMSGGGDMGARMRAHDWSRTPFGPVSQWPQSLRTALRICLDSRFPILIWWGPELRMLYNDAYRPSLGSTKDPHALGAPGHEIWGDIWNTIGPMLEGVVRTGRATWENDQVLLFDRNGYVEESYWTYSYSAIRLASGEIGGVFSAIHEVTDRVLTARRLKTLREVADQVVQAKNDVDACHLAMQSIVRNPADCPFAMIFVCDGKKAVREAASFDAGERIPSILDLSEQDAWAVGETVRSRTPQVFEIANPEAMPGAPYGDKCKQAISLPILGATRETIAVLTLGISPYRAFDESYEGFFESLAKNLAANINNARAYDEERKRAEALAELDRAKTLFFSNVSHEFRTPLTLMLGPLEDSLVSSQGLPPEQRERLEVAHRNSVRLLRLVNTLLDFSRIEAGRIQASYEPTDVAKFTAELASVFRSATERAGLKLVIDCPPIPEPVYVDREMWEKIVLNLISNAFKFTLAGEIEIKLRQGEGTVELSVSDTGTGIPAGELPRLFERFHRVKGAKGRTFEGSGIGLSLVQELTRLHGGSIRVKSRERHGSTFTVSIPLGKAHLPADRIGARRTLESTGLRGEAYLQEALRWLPQTERSPDENSLAELLSPAETLPQTKAEAEKTQHILLADDNADMRDYVHRLLSERYRVTSVADGEAALKSAREHSPDLILSDVMMPQMDGFGLLQALRSDEKLREVPVILLSARAGEESRIEGLQSGADDYLVKPFSARELFARVQTHLALARIRKEAEENLRKSEERLRALVHASSNVIYRMSPDWTEMRQLDGRSFLRDTPTAKQNWIDEYILPEDRPRVLEAIEKAIREKSIFELEHRVRRADGGVGWTLSRAVPLFDAGGEIAEWFGAARDVTERKQAEQEKEAVHKRLQRVIDSITDGLVVLDREWRTTYVSETGAKILGMDRKAILGKIVWEVFPHAKGTKFYECYRRALDTGEPQHFEEYYPNPLNQWLECHCYPSEEGLTVYFHDVTERHKTEEALQEQRERFDLVAHAAQVGFWFCDLPFDKLIWDNRVKEHFWLPPDAEVTIDTFYRRLHPDDREATRKAIEASIAKNGVYAVEYRTVSPDGRGEKRIRAIGRTYYDLAGKATRFDGVTFDVTDRRLAEERERKMTAEAVAVNAKFRSVFEQTPVFAGVMAKSGELMEANKLSLDACGYRLDEVIGRPFWETGWWRQHPESREKIRAAVPDAAKGVPYRETLLYSWGDGTERVVDFALYPIVDDQGHVLFLHPTGIDITDLKHAEENYQALVKNLDSQVRARTNELEQRTADVVRHTEQLRELSWRLLHAQEEERRHIARELHDSAGQTLTILGINLAQLAQKAGRKAPELAGDAEMIQKTVQQLHREIRTTSYLLHPPLLDETGLSSALRWYVSGLTERSGLEIRLSIDDDFGRLPSDMELLVFRLVQECLTNIHRHSGSKMGSIRVTREADAIRVEIQDQGKGMSPERLAQVQSHNSGVGIRGMRERLRQFNGQMKIDSDNSGTRVFVTIPILKAASEGPESDLESLRVAI